MLEAHNSSNESEPNADRNSGFPPGDPKRRPFLIWLAGILLASLGGGIGYGWFFIGRQLTPRLETELTDLFNRPVKIGSVERLSLTGVRFGDSELPATASDPDWVKVEAVDVAIAPLSLLFRRELQLDVTLIRPDLYIEQDEQKRWLSIELDPPTGKQSAIKTELQTVNFQHSEMTLAARSPTGGLKPSVRAAIPSGSAHFFNDAKLIQFDLAGRLLAGGKFEVDGSFQTPTDAINLVVTGNELAATAIGNLLELPLKLHSGTLDSNLEVQLRQGQVAALNGIATLEGVTARIPELPQPFAQTNGQLRFQGSQIYLDQVRSLFGSVPTVAEGVIDTAWGTLQVEAQTAPVDVNQAIAALKLDPPLPLAGEIQAAIAVAGTNERPKLDIDVATVTPSKIGRVDFRRIDADLALIDSQLVVESFRALPTVGGNVTGTGEVQLESGKYAFDVRSEKVPSRIVRAYEVSLPIDPEPISGVARIIGNLNNTEALEALGFANFSFGGGTVSASNIQVNSQRWQADVQASAVQLSSLADVPSQLRQERLDGTFKVSGPVNSLTPQTVRATGAARIEFAGGAIATKNLTLADGRWSALVEAQEIGLQELVPSSPTDGVLFGSFDLAGSVDNLTLAGVQGDGTGQLQIGEGTVAAREIEIEGERFTAVAVPNNLPLERISADLQGRLGGELTVTGNLNQIDPTSVQAQGQVTLSQGITFVERPLTADVDWDGRRLDIEQVTGEGISASGFVEVNPSFFAPTGQDALSEIEQLVLDVEAAQGLDVTTLPIPLPPPLTKLDYSGAVDFAGDISGSPLNPVIRGEMALKDFTVESLQFSPVLTGTVQIAPETGADLKLAGGDRLELQLSPDYQPQSFLVELDRPEETALMSGSHQGERLQVEAQNFPIAPLRDVALAINPTLPPLTTQLSGSLTGEFAVALDTFDVSGSGIEVSEPMIGRLEGDRLTGQFEYADQQLTLTDGVFEQGESRYQFEGSLDQTPEGPQFQAQVAVEQGQIQEILETLEIFELSDLSRGLRKPNYADAADLYDSDSASPSGTLFSVGIPEATILEQLSRLAEIDAWLVNERQERERSSFLPALKTLEGTFDGTITVASSLQSGTEAEFDFQGQQWQWGPYNADQVIARGSFEDGILTLLPFRFQSEDSLFNFSGSFGGETQSGQLRLVSVPVTLVREFVELPPAIGIGGQVNATVAIAGSQANPQARGELRVDNATINQTSIQETQGSFSYNDARLNFFVSSILAEAAEPLTVVGSFPYQLPLATVEPESNELNLSVNVRDRGLALLDILTKNNLVWVEGNGEVSLDLSGKFNQEANQLSQLQAQGRASVEQAKIAAQFLPEAPLTNINGTVLFNLDRLEVDTLKGNIGGGKFLVAGTLPLSPTAPQSSVDPAQNLIVALRDATFDLQGLYQGGAQGQIAITGSAITPNISGEVELFDGEVQLGQTASNSQMSSDDQGLMEATDFNNLRLKLGDNVRLVRPPILNFLATGSLVVNGKFNNPLPEGTIRLRRGQVNLFTTQFQLAGGEENSAQFFSDRGLDPYLDINLVTSVIETDDAPPRQDPFSADVREILPNQLGALQTVRVQAEVEGYASQLTDSIGLSSSPPRSETEIVALLGGGFVDTFGRGDTTLGIANLAGSAFFSSFQGAIGEALGLSEFRIFPAPIVNEQKQTTFLGLAAEASVDLTSELSFSVLKILNTDQPAQYGIRYRLDDQTILRGSTDFDHDSRAIIEFEQRF